MRPGRDVVKARAETGREGRWRVDGFPSPTGSWYATVRTRSIATADGDVIWCARDNSPVLHF